MSSDTAQSIVSQDGPDLAVRVDATRSVGRVGPFWASQIIHPTESLLTEEGHLFLQMLADSGAAREYVRVYNQPEEAIRQASDGSVWYDWSRFDAMAERILATGNVLKIVFFGMPYQLAADPQRVKIRPNGAQVCISPPADYEQWRRLCSEFTRHVLETYGREEVCRWTFRCWNEPDLGNFWYNQDVGEYLKLYDYFAAGVKAVCSDIPIGGPGLSSSKTYLQPDNFTFFLDHVVNGTNHATGETGSPIDYLAVHTYAGKSAGGGPGYAHPDIAYMIEQQIRYADMRDMYPSLRGLPIHVEEWGEASGGTTGVADNPMAAIRNTHHGAALLTAWVQHHIALRQEHDRGFASFTFCSSGYEKPRVRDFMGYRTLHTRSGFHKPILNGYKLLDKVAPELVQFEPIRSGTPVCGFASRDDRRVTVVLTNYQPDRINNDGTTYHVTLDIAFPWPVDTEAEARHWRIDADHSNACTVFEAIGAPDEPTAEQIEVVKRRMDLEMLVQPESRSCGSLTPFVIELPCNAVSMIEVSI